MARTEVTGRQIKDKSVSLSDDVVDTLPVANGGTGVASIASGSVLVGNGTDAVTTVSPGTSGYVLTSNGSAWVSAAPSGGVTLNGAETLYNKTLTSPTLITPALGTPSSGTLTNCTGLPVGGISATGTPGATTYLRGDGSWQTVSASGSGDASTNTATSVDSEVAVFSGTGGKTLKRATGSGLAVLSSGVLSTVTAPTGTVVGTTDSQGLSNKTLTNPTVTNYTESVVAIGTVTTAATINLTSGTVQTATLTASTACTFTMPTAVAGKSFVLMLKQAASTGNGTATFTGVKWNSAGAPTITATAGGMDILSFFSDGTNWYGSASQGFTP